MYIWLCRLCSREILRHQLSDSRIDHLHCQALAHACDDTGGCFEYIELLFISNTAMPILRRIVIGCSLLSRASDSAFGSGTCTSATQSGKWAGRWSRIDIAELWVWCMQRLPIRANFSLTADFGRQQICLGKICGSKSLQLQLARLLLYIQLGSAVPPRSCAWLYAIGLRAMHFWQSRILLRLWAGPGVANYGPTYLSLSLSRM